MFEIPRIYQNNTIYTKPLRYVAPTQESTPARSVEAHPERRQQERRRQERRRQNAHPRVDRRVSADRRGTGHVIDTKV